MAPKPAFPQNAQIEHPKFGCGTVLSCDEEYVVIRFDDHGQKKFVSSIVVPNLKKIDRQPPAATRSKSRRPKTKKAAGVSD
jgi:hypothetical protein